MSEQAQPALAHLKKVAEHHKIVLAAQKEFEEQFGGQLEVVESHLQHFNAIHQKHLDGQRRPE